MVILMAYVAKLRLAGLKLSLDGDWVIVENAECLTNRHREFIRTNRPSILRELKIEAKHNLFLA